MFPASTVNLFSVLQWGEGPSTTSFYSPGTSTAFFIFMGAAMAVENKFITNSIEMSDKDDMSGKSGALHRTKSNGQKNKLRADGTSSPPPKTSSVPEHRAALQFLCALPCVAWLFDRRHLRQRRMAPLVVAVHLALWGPLFKALFLKPWVDSGMFGAIALLFPQLVCEYNST